MPSLDLSADVVDLTRQLVDIESVSHREGPIADAVEAALRAMPHLTVERFGNTMVARTDAGRGERVVLAGHLDTVPVADNLPSRSDERYLYGVGTSDMKSGDAVILKIAQLGATAAYNRDLTIVFYDAEEVAAEHNGLRKLAEARPELLEADFAILMESSEALIEAGCQGTLRAEVRTHGIRAHSARSWMGENAIHRAGEILARLTAYEPRRPVIDGLTYREGLNAVGIAGGVAGNVVPDEAVVTVNYRFAPDLSEAEAEAHVREVFAGFEVRVTDSAPGALPGLDQPAAKAFASLVGGTPRPKYGWTDVARFSALGVPAVNYGPGDPSLAHRADERVEIAHIRACFDVLRTWLTDSAS